MTMKQNKRLRPKFYQSSGVFKGDKVSSSFYIYCVWCSLLFSTTHRKTSFKTFKASRKFVAIPITLSEGALQGHIELVYTDNFYSGDWQRWFHSCMFIIYKIISVKCLGFKIPAVIADGDNAEFVFFFPCSICIGWTYLPETWHVRFIAPWEDIACHLWRFVTTEALI